MRHYCTLFDRHYAYRGLAMYYSLIGLGEDFCLYAFAFDKETESLLAKLSLERLVIISLEEFEDPELLNVKASRTKVEYCWTCTPSVILYCINRFHLAECSYIDADLLFLSSPESIYNEIAESSVCLTRHGFSEKYESYVTNGIYNVQFMYFKSDERGLRALEWWRERCLEWCHDRLEDGKFGDQLYLDDWLERFDGVHVLCDNGRTLAPWNIQRFEVLDSLTGTVTVSEDDVVVHPVFYHFHGVKISELGCLVASNYDLSDNVVRSLYEPYALALGEAIVTVRQVDPDWKYGFQVNYHAIDIYGLTRRFFKSDDSKVMIYDQDIFAKSLEISRPDRIVWYARAFWMHLYRLTCHVPNWIKEKLKKILRIRRVRG